MFIETLEFTIPVDLCDVFNTMKRGSQTNCEFPASVNSYGTTQDANVQMVLRSNKLTFRVDGVSSDASIISKSECKTLKLSIFDVDRSLMPQDELEDDKLYAEEISVSHALSTSHSLPVSLPVKRTNSFTEVRTQSHKVRKISDTTRSGTHINQNHTQPDDSRVNVKEEPHDPDIIEIEADILDDIVPKNESGASFMQADYSSSNIPETRTYNQQSSSSSFHENVPHVPDYAEPGPSHHGDQSADDYVVYHGGDGDNEDYDNEADYSNDDHTTNTQKDRKKSPKTRAEIQKAYRERLKEKEGEAYYARERSRRRKSYIPSAQLTKKQLLFRKEKNRRHLRKFRRKKKAEKNFSIVETAVYMNNH